MLTDREADRLTKQAIKVQKLTAIATAIGASPIEFRNQFESYRQTSTYSFDDLFRIVEQRFQAGLAMPWNDDSGRRRFSVPTHWRIKWGDEDDDWRPVDRRLKPVIRVKAAQLRCCAACRSLINFEQFGKPQCQRPNGPIFENGVDALFQRCGHFRKGRTDEQVKELIK